MKSFLDHIVDGIAEADVSGLKNKCYVFPTKRGGLHFQNLLQKRFSSQTFIAPRILSIEEFISEQCPEIAIADELTLLFKLYELYKHEEPGLSFENFFVWGQTILRDFDEIDRYLLEGDKVYQNLSEMSELDAAFGPNEEMIKAHEEFQKVIEVSQGADLYNKFLKNWLTVGKVRPIFIQSIRQEGLGYAGICYREVAERMLAGNTETGYAEVNFVGFNALSKSEEQIFKCLLDNKQARVFFDADEYYLDNEAEEAGKFLREYKKRWKQPGVTWVINKGFKQPKKIQITGTSQQVVQAREAGRLAAEQENYAVVLADENLLMPVLYSLPEHRALNITMGYQLMNSAVGGFLLAYMRNQAAVAPGSRTSENPLLERTALEELYEQSYVQSGFPINLKIPGKSRWVSFSTLTELMREHQHAAELVSLATIHTQAQGCLDSLEGAVLTLFNQQRDQDRTQVIFTEKIVAQTLRYLQNLRFMIAEYQPGIGIPTLERVIRETFKTQKVPFSGEPLVGTQVMGFLETRTLDFENLVVLSVNEGKLPSTSTGKSYLPFGLRKSFGLPTFIEQNAIYAYHFFRLLQRPENITLIYSSQLAFDGSGEKSRFILQLIDRLKEFPAIHVIQEQIVTSISDSLGETPITINKTGLVEQQLVAHEQKLLEKYLSPTALVQYIECGLKYYFAKIQGLRAEDVPSEDIDAREFGNILHQVMEDVYARHLNQELEEQQIDKLKNESLPGIIEDVFNEYTSGSKETGEISFTKHVMAHLTNKIMLNDIEDAPLLIEDLESRSEMLEYLLPLSNDRMIRLSGKIDRLDALKFEDSWLYRILDYKTGSFELGKTKSGYTALSDEEYVDQYFENPKVKAGFQAYYYALLFSKIYPEKLITGGIIGAKNLNEGVAYLRGSKHPINTHILQLFEEKLTNKVEEIFDRSVPFTQTDDTDRCTYCDYKNICRR